jgi:hypothetical protein
LRSKKINKNSASLKDWPFCWFVSSLTSFYERKIVMSQGIAETSVDSMQPDGFIIVSEEAEITLCLQEGDHWLFFPAKPIIGPIFSEIDFPI